MRIRLPALLAPVLLISVLAQAAESPLHGWELGEGLRARFGGLEGGALAEPRIEDGAMVFDGANRVRVEGVKPADLPKERLSAEAWVMVEQGTRWGSFIGFMQDNGDFERGWLLGYDEKVFTFAVSNGGPLQWARSTTGFAKDKWFHVAGTYDGTRVRIYVNGVLEGEAETSGGAIAYPEAAFYTLGAYQDDDEFYPLKGKMRSARLYDGVLDAARVKALYDEGRAELPQEILFSVRPALRFVGQDSARVQWESSIAGSGAVAFGKTRALGTVVNSAGKDGLEHEVILTGLEPGETYYYKIGMTAEGGKRHFSGTYEFSTAVNFSLPAQTASTPVPELVAEEAKRILAMSGVAKGYCVSLGCGDGHLLDALARQSELVVVALETDAARVEEVRRRLYAAKGYGARVSVMEIEAWNQIPLTACVANLIVCPEATVPVSDAVLTSLLVPGSGKACLPDGNGGIRVLSRPALEGAGEWTHQYGTPANLASNGEKLGGVKATGEMKVQWFGRPGADFGIDRNPRMPAPVAANGRLFHQGMDRMVALDSSNGAVLWGLEIPDLRRVNIPRDCGNWCVDDDSLYVAIRERAWIFAAATGERRGTLPVLPSETPSQDWGFIAREGIRLYGSRVRAEAVYSSFWDRTAWVDAKAGDGTGKVCSENLFAYDLSTGKPAWVYENGMILNATITIGEGRVWFVESRNAEAMAAPERQVTSEKLWLDQYLVALDAVTGEKLLEQPIDTEDGTVTYYLQATPRGILISASNSQYHLYLFDAETGALKWQRSNPWPDADHSGHMLHPVVMHDTIYIQPNGYALETGEIVTTGVGARRGCHTYVGVGENLLYRGPDGQLAFWDRKSEAVSYWDRLRPSCWLSVVPSNGMLLVPEGGGGCSCGGWMETSVVFAPGTLLGYPVMEGGTQ
jgi:outer membrane protein assembly factor BamB